jgi:hypothetical protein
MKKTTASKGVPQPVVTPEERYHMINDAAYFRALKHRHETGEPEDQAASWCEVESEIDGVLKKHHATE